MVKLGVEDRRQLMTLLEGLPDLATEEDRRQVLKDSGLAKLVPRINISGRTRTAIGNIVDFLAPYGHYTDEQEALGMFLNTIKLLVGQEQQEFLANLLLRYRMMIPVASSPDVDKWYGSENDKEVAERIIGENTLRPIAFLAQALHVARSIAFVRTPGWSGTGFLIAPNLLLTNHHVLPDVNLLSSSLFRFNYEENWLGEAQPVEEYRAASNGIFHTNEPLDYALVQLDQEPGRKWGWLTLQSAEVKRNERVNIIQHPAGQLKQISFQNNFVEYVGDNVLQYVTSTLPGSSGAPVMNDRWQVVAIHHAGGLLTEPSTHHRYFRNEGVLISSILDNLPIMLRQIVGSAAVG